MKRIVEIASPGYRARFEEGALVISHDNQDAVIPAQDVAALVLAMPAVSLTGAVLAELAARGAAVVVCDWRFVPVGALMPLSPHHRHAAVLAAQARTPPSLGGRLWRQLVMAKLKGQAAVLAWRGLPGDDLRAMAGQVQRGDPDNLEGRAARLYWRRLACFPARDRHADDANRLFNYAYAVVFAAAGRALCAAGLHPGLGLRHHNQYNPYCLASDVMEPYRALADCAVLSWLGGGRPPALDQEAKRFILRELLAARPVVGGQALGLFPALAATATSLRDCLSRRRRDLALPVFRPGEAPCG